MKTKLTKPRKATKPRKTKAQTIDHEVGPAYTLKPTDDSAVLLEILGALNVLVNLQEDQISAIKAVLAGEPIPQN